MKVIRKAIPRAVRELVESNQGGRCKVCGAPLVKGNKVHDHRPPLMNRSWNARKRDYEPASNDPRYIEAICDDPCNKRRTFGPGGERRITTRGGDIGEKSHENDMRDKMEEHRRAMKRKRPGRGRDSKGSIQSRPFQKGKRPWRR